MTDTEQDAIRVLTRTLRNMPTPVLRRMADSATPTTAAVARALLDTRDDAEPLNHTIFPI